MNDNYDLSQLDYTIAADAGNNLDHPLPPGVYSVLIDAAEVKTTKAGTGLYLNLMLSVLDEKYANRKLFARINLKNPSKKAESIGGLQLGALAHAVGFATKPSNALEFVDKTLKVRVAIDKNDANENNVKGYLPMSDATPAPVQPAAQAAAPVAQAVVPKQESNTVNVPSAPWPWL